MTMPVVIKIIGALFILIAIGYLVKPEVIKTLIEFFKKGNRLYISAAVRLVLAVVFLLAASQCHIPALIIVFGILFLLGALLILILGPAKLRPMLTWWQSRPLWTIRLLAAVTLIVGALVIYAA